VCVGLAASWSVVLRLCDGCDVIYVVVNRRCCHA
jgi:hypothetical protein